MRYLGVNVRRTLFTIAAVLAIGIAGLSAADERATVTGKVTDAAGRPLDHATVLVYEGRIKKGYGVYCPSCWVDCGKHAVTDAEGSFTISSLNHDLRFKLLVVKPQYSAAFIDNVDPAKGPAPTASLKPRPPIEDASQVVRGRVVDTSGTPVKDAVVAQQGITLRGPHGLQQQFGSLGWIDIVTATNEKGEFEMAYDKPAVEMILSIDARAMAPKLVTEPTGAERRTITVTQGAVIRGRLLRPDGKPVANAEVGLSAHSRVAGTTFSGIRIGTRDDGTFAMTNVPAGRVWYLYPTMESLAAQALAADPLLCETENDGQDLNLGDIQLHPAYTLRGKVVLSDGKPVPPDMRMTLGADWSASQVTVLAADGSFEFKGLTSAAYTLVPGVKGYKLAGGRGIEVLVNRDRSDVVLRLEPAAPPQ
jgi:protocatechuate 3,4-dioxygenase beta subunit